MRNVIAAAAALFLLLPNLSYAQSLPEFHISRAQQPPKIDGDLHDEAWATTLSS